MFSKDLVKLATIGVGSAGATFIILKEVALITKVEGNSMQPTLNPFCGQINAPLLQAALNRDELARELKTRITQDRILLNKWITRDRAKNLRVGDVIVLVSPTNPARILIKRITAMPGDIIYLVETGDIKVIDEGHCWVEGDNQKSSNDSNSFGQVPLGLIEGKVCYIVWPLHRFGSVLCDPNFALNSTRTKLLNQDHSPREHIVTI